MLKLHQHSNTHLMHTTYIQILTKPTFINKVLKHILYTVNKMDFIHQVKDQNVSFTFNFRVLRQNRENLSHEDLQ